MIAHYVIDGDQPLTAETSGNTTFYLYGLGAIAEKANAWSYSLPDGTNTPRQLTNLTGDITLTALYTPWGDNVASISDWSHRGPHGWAYGQAVRSMILAGTVELGPHG